MAFGSIGEFRAALNSLVARTNRGGKRQVPQSDLVIRRPKQLPAKFNPNLRRKINKLAVAGKTKCSWCNGRAVSTVNDPGQPEHGEPVCAQHMVEFSDREVYDSSGDSAWAERNPAAASIEHSIRQGSNRELDRDLVLFSSKLKAARAKGDAWGIEWASDRLAVAKDEIKRRKKSGAWTAARGSKARKNMARHNMATRMLPGGAMEFDTPEEMARYVALQGGAARSSLPMPRAAGGGRAPRAAGPKPIKKPVSFPGQCGLIGKSIGGLKAYAPGFAGQSLQKGGEGPHMSALAGMGLTAERADAVCTAMIRAGVASRSPENPNAARARQILAEVGGVGVSAAKNPRRRKAKRNPPWTRAY